jgi:hypothetical protein
MPRTSFVATALLVSGALLGGCSTTRTPLAPVSGHPTYQIECIHPGECWTEARRACGGTYQTLERYDNRIPESELPGLNTRTVAHGWRASYRPAMPRTVGSYGPDFESDEPLPLTGVVVACTDVPLR